MNSFIRKHYNSLILLSLLFFLVVNKSVLVDLYNKWYAQGLTGPYAHGLLIAVIVAYLAARKIIELRPSLYPSLSLLGIFLLAGSQVSMLLARLADVNFVQHLAIISTVTCIVWAAYSFRLVKHFIVLAMLLLFTLPVWGGIEPPLQKISIVTTNAILALTGIPYYLEGTYFHFSSGIIQIAPECAGMQQMLVSMIVGLLFSVQFRLRFRDTVKTLIYLAVAAIIINTIRIIIIMIVGYYTKMESSLITKHLLLGWIIYGIGVFAFLYFYSGRKFVRPAPVVANNNSQTRRKQTASRHLYLFLLFLALILMLPTVSNQLLVHSINSHQIRPVEFDQADASWHKLSPRIPINWHPDYPRGDSQFTATFHNGGHNIYIFINAYYHIKSGVEPMNMDNTAYNRNNWRILKHSLGHIQINNGPSGNVSLDVVDSASSQPLLIMSFYLIDGKVSVKLVQSKLYKMFGMLRGRYDIKQVSLATPIQPGAGYGAELDRLKNFTKTMLVN